MSAAGVPFPSAVLIVDDEQTVINLLTQVFKKHKLDARGAMTAADGLQALKSERFGCLLVDKNLPDQSGLEVIREAKRQQPYCASLVMTGFPTADSVVQALRLGATDYLEKPFADLGLVVQRVQAAMEHARTAFEREALARTLRDMRAQLKKSAEAVFQRQTELDVFVQVLDLRVEEATRPLIVQTGHLSADLDELKKQLEARTAKSRHLADALKALATRAGLAAKRPALTLADAREALENLERALTETADGATD